MSKRILAILNRGKNYFQLAELNEKAISDYNDNTLSVLTFLGCILMLLPVLASPFSSTKADIVLFYLLVSLLFLTIFFLNRFSFLKNYTLIGLYITGSIFFSLAIYLSVYHSPDMRATILLGAFCVVPLSFIDRPLRMNSFVFFWFVVHTILAINLKPQFALDDTINTLGFAILGCHIGNVMLWDRLEGYEVHRLLIIQKETDVLTGLYNRRKLYESLIELETSNEEKPSGVLMIDIDNFKEFNDNYGHAMGDKCMNLIGEMLIKFSQNFRLSFYRYGGEEFVALAYGYSEQELLSIAESIRIAAQSLDIDGHSTTVSIGVAYCEGEQVQNYERVIDRADKAVYEAKRSGRNKVCV